MYHPAACYHVICIGAFRIANIYKFPSAHWNITTSLPDLPHPAVLVGDFNSPHPDWDYQIPTEDENYLVEWSPQNDFHIVYDPKERGTCPTVCRRNVINGSQYVFLRKVGPFDVILQILIIFHIYCKIPKISYSRNGRLVSNLRIDVTSLV